MHPRIDLTRHLNSGMGRAMFALSGEVGKNLDRRLFELVKIRASQINGCAYCIDMHTKDARLAGETEQRSYALNAWRETPFFTDRERAALEWTEALTLISSSHAPSSSIATIAGDQGEYIQPGSGTRGGRAPLAELTKRARFGHGQGVSISAFPKYFDRYRAMVAARKPRPFTLVAARINCESRRSNRQKPRPHR